MSPHQVPASRVRAVNQAPVRPSARFVLYWMTAARRLSANFALQHAADAARAWGRPLVILEALRVDYPWASDRLHQFVLDGMADHARALSGQPVVYLPYLERAPGAGRGLLAALGASACLVVADDYPAFFLPRMVAAAGARLDVRLDAVDGNGLLPMRDDARTFPTAFSFRAHVQRVLRAHLPAWPRDLDPATLPAPARDTVDPAITRRWPVATLAELTDPALVSTLPIDHSVHPAERRGGPVAAHAALARFTRDALPRYQDDRNQPSLDGTSGLSPYLHFGHIGAHEVFAAVMTAERWTSRQLGAPTGGRREGWWGVSPSAEGFLDQLVTWRELGFNMCVTRPDDYMTYASLPAWAQRTLGTHATDRRAWIYTRGEFTDAGTHDQVWNAAQRQLTRDGWMHNYLRMLWGKKILEWTPAPEDALETMIAVMDRHALDGRDPNSYTGYLWTLGRYDRPWAPERAIFGTIRYMSSDNTMKKLRLRPYLEKYGPGQAT